MCTKLNFHINQKSDIIKKGDLYEYNRINKNNAKRI